MDAPVSLHDGSIARQIRSPQPVTGGRGYAKVDGPCQTANLWLKRASSARFGIAITVVVSGAMTGMRGRSSISNEWTGIPQTIRTVCPPPVCHSESGITQSIDFSRVGHSRTVDGKESVRNMPDHEIAGGIEDIAAQGSALGWSRRKQPDEVEGRPARVAGDPAADGMAFVHA